MSDDQLLRQLLKEIASIAKRFDVAGSRAFPIWFGMAFCNLSEEEAFEASAIDGANDKGIDFFHVNHDDEIVIVAQCKSSKEGKARGSTGDIDGLLSGLSWLADPEACRVEGRPELTAAAQDYRDALENAYAVEAAYVRMGPKSRTIQKHIDVVARDVASRPGKPSVHSYDIARLLNAFSELVGDTRRIDSETLRFLDEAPLEVKGQFGDAIVVTLPASELVRLHERYGDRLFDRNVRLYLGARKRSINAGIATTLNNLSSKSNFWAYNNGITFVCDNVRTDGDGLCVSNFSIVNGCQTTCVLAENREQVSKEVRVLARFIAPPEGMVDDIILYTNSQNPVRAWDIASQNPIQIRLRDELQRLSPPWLYLIRRGEKPSRQERDAYRDGSDRREMRIDELGQYIAAFDEEPTIAYKNKAFVFSKHHNTFFPRDITVERVLFIWRCGCICRELVLRKRPEARAETASILKKGGQLFVLAVMGKTVRMRNGASFLNGLSARQVTSTRTREKLEAYAEYSLNSYIGAVQDLAELRVAELPTLLRQPEFFSDVLARVERQYEKDRINRKWMDGALPKLKK